MQLPCGISRLNANVRGVLWMLLAGFFFSVMVALIKMLGSRFPSIEIVFFRSVVQLGVLLVIFSRIGFSSLTTRRPGLQGLRALLAIALINCNFYAFTKMPLAEVTAIGFSRNLFLVVLAMFFLGERLKLNRALVTFIGFIGILVIVRPGAGVFNSAAWVALMGAGLGALMMTLVRKLTFTESNITMMTFPSLAIVISTSIPVMLMWVTPTAQELSFLFLMSCTGIIGQWCMIQAFRNGEATAVAPANYVRLIFASTIGFYFFAETPDLFTVWGAILIVGSNILLVVQESKIPKSETGMRVPGDVT